MEIRLETIKGVGDKLIRHFRRAGIWSTYDLLLHVPKGYEDFTITSLERAQDNTTITVLATVKTPLENQRLRRVERQQFQAEVMGKTVDVVIFNRAYLVKQLKPGDDIIIKGVYHLYRKQLVAATIKMAGKVPAIKPVYGIEGVYDQTVSKIVKTILDEQQVTIHETIPVEFLTAYQMPDRTRAFVMIHLPERFDDIRQARRRFKYEEAFYLQLKLQTGLAAQPARPPKPYDLAVVKQIITGLPYELTDDQKQAVNDLFRDFKNGQAGFRLIQGDVGSGKTMVAALGALACVTAGEQVAFMAPTELLAIQHARFFHAQFPLLRTALLTRKTKDKPLVKTHIRQQQYDLVIGTHAMIEQDVIFNRLGLVIIDEQHKFGVNTRDELVKKAWAKDVIYLTATPIPRTLAMIAFGESNVSIIHEKPKNRQPIKTHYLTRNQIEPLYQAIQETLLQKQHVYLVVPAITSLERGDNIDTVYQDIKDRFDAPLFVLHGQLKEDEKETRMKAFVDTPGSILLATTMIEVGIDVPTATLIAIYGAEHFGLSQLHQLRGRVGRSHLPSRCFLIATQEDVERLELLVKTNDGFVLSEYDLMARGPGDFLGLEQSGHFRFRFLDLISDQPVLMEAQKNVRDLLAQPAFKKNPDYRYLHRHMKSIIRM